MFLPQAPPDLKCPYCPKRMKSKAFSMMKKHIKDDHPTKDQNVKLIPQAPPTHAPSPILPKKRKKKNQK